MVAEVRCERSRAAVAAVVGSIAWGAGERGRGGIPYSPVVKLAVADQTYAGGLNSLKPASFVKAHRHTCSRFHELHDVPAQAVQAWGRETMKHHLVSLREVEPISLAAHWVAPETADIHGGRVRQGGLRRGHRVCWGSSV